jgi:hypothetical protein
MTTTAPPRSDAKRLLIGIPVCLLANAAVIFAVVQSPYGSLGFFDDAPSSSDWSIPMVAGAAIGLLQGLAFSTRAALIASGLTVLLGLMTFIFIYPAANCAIGSALGAGVAAALGRWWRVPFSSLVAIVLLTTASVAAAVYGAIDHTPEPLPLVKVLRSADGPAVLVDQQERIKSTNAVGTLADVDGCLGLVDASVGDGIVLVFWRLGTSVSSDPFRLIIDGKAYGIGDKVTVPGAGLLTHERDLEAYRPDIPASCAGHDLFL